MTDDKPEIDKVVTSSPMDLVLQRENERIRRTKLLETVLAALMIVVKPYNHWGNCKCCNQRKSEGHDDGCYFVQAEALLNDK